jgi:hypothetical protein
LFCCKPTLDLQASKQTNKQASKGIQLQLCFMIMHPKSKFCSKTHELVAAPELIFNKTKEDPATDFDFSFFPLLLKFKSGKQSLEKAYKRKSNVDLEIPDLQAARLNQSTVILVVISQSHEITQ